MPRKPVKNPGRKTTKAQKEQIINEGINKILFEHYTWEEFQKWIREAHTIKDSNPYWKECWVKIQDRFNVTFKMFGFIHDCKDGRCGGYGQHHLNQ